jgi:hypothetical protein
LLFTFHLKSSSHFLFIPIVCSITRRVKRKKAIA